VDGEIAGNVEGATGGSGASAHDVYAKGHGTGTREQGVTSLAAHGVRIIGELGGRLVRMF
jgi:hypothetical protein